MTVVTRTHILAFVGLFGGGILAAPVVLRRRRHATMLATVTPFAEDHFPGKFGKKGYVRHQCHIKPDDASQLPFQALCPAMTISAYATRHMEINLRADTVDDDEPVVVNAVPADSDGGGSALDMAADVRGDGHCVMPHADGNSCVGRTILHVRLQFDDDGPDCKNLSDLAVALALGQPHHPGPGPP